MNKKILFFARLGVTFIIIFILFKCIPYQKLVETFQNSQKIYILYSFLVFILSFFIAIVRWHYLLHSLNIKVSFRETTLATFSAMALNLFFPSFIAGDVFRGFSITLRYGNGEKVASSILMDRFCGFVALVLITLVPFILGIRLFFDIKIFYALLMLCFIVGVASLLIFSKNFFLSFIKIFKKTKFGEKLISFHNQLYFFKENPGIFFKTVIISLAIQILTPYGFFVASKAFDLKVELFYFLILIPIAMTVAMMPITIAGAGTREAAVVSLFSLIGVNKAVSLSMSMLNAAFMVVVGAIGGILYVTIYHRWIQCDIQNSRLKGFSGSAQ